MIKITKQLVVKVLTYALILLFAFPVTIYAFSNNFGFNQISRSEDSFSTLSNVNSKSVTVGESLRLNIDWMVGDIEIATHSNQNVLIQEFIEGEVDKEFVMSVIHDDASNISVKWTDNEFKTNKPFDNSDKNLKISVPSSTVISELTINSIHTNLNMSNINPTLIDINIDTGSITLSKVNSETVGMKLDDGTITLNNMLTSSIKINAESAHTKALNVTSDELSFLSNSSDFTFEGKTNDLSAKSVFGNMDINVSSSVYDCFIEAIYGNAEVTVAEISDFSLNRTDLSYLSGEIRVSGFSIDEVEGDEFHQDLNSPNSYVLSTSDGSIELSNGGVPNTYESYYEWLDNLD